MKEMSKSIVRRLHESNFITRYFVGDGIDIGGFPDPLTIYSDLFPLVKSIKVWDVLDGDAQYMSTIKDETFDFVVSSHCLEHLKDPYIGLKNWFRILKPAGYLIVTIPDEDLYEQSSWPSEMNFDHKNTFTISKSSTWSPKSVNVFDLIISLGPSAAVKKISLEDATYHYTWPKFDQTLTPTTESAIEFIIRKRSPEEIEVGSDRNKTANFDKSLSPYLNQYIHDKKVLKESAKANPPFQIQ
jgi:SAM-dependent methyltransferase